MPVDLEAEEVAEALEDQRDPARWWSFAVPRLRQALAMFCDPVDPIDELLARGANGTGKTESLCMYDIECMKGRSTLNGCPLPQWGGPIEVLCCVLDYKTQLLSVQPAFMRCLGKWPFKTLRNGEALSSLRVSMTPEGNDESAWSVLHFLSQENRRIGVGARADIVHFDEPPHVEVLDEVRKAAHAHRRSIRIIGMTPTIRSQWAPIREQYGDTPRGCIRRVDSYRAEVRWSLGDAASWLLSDKRKEAMRAAYALRPALAAAREHGDYESTEGKCPFDVETLLAMMALCREPEMVTWRVSREATEEGEAATVVKVPVEVWEAPQQGQRYFLTIDPASGVDDNAHNPAGLQVAKHGSGDLVARWNGYLAPYSLGALGAGLGRQYNMAAADIEMMDHWGVNVVRGFNASEYPHMCREQRELRPGEWANEVGFMNNAQGRAAIIGAIQTWVEDWRSGIKYAACPSRAVIECLLDTELDDRGKIVAGPGIAHGEDMILWGQKLRRAVTRPNRRTPELNRPAPTEDEFIRRENDRLARIIRGEEEHETNGYRGRTLMHTPRRSGR